METQIYIDGTRLLITVVGFVMCGFFAYRIGYEKGKKNLVK